MPGEPQRSLNVEGLVSVVVPVFNRPRMLVEAVDSALQQTYPAVEVVIVDDASSDDTPSIATALTRREPDRVRVLRHESNRGPGASRETGRVAASGEFLQYLDSDDLLLPRKLELQVKLLRDDPEVDIAYGWTRRRASHGTLEEQPTRGTGEVVERLFPRLLEGRLWITATPLLRRSSTDKVGPWPSLRRDEDWLYEARLGAAGVRLAAVPDWVAEHRAHGGVHAGRIDWRDRDALSARASVHREVYRLATRAGVAPSAPEMAHFARSLFHLARRCSAAGLSQDAQRLLDLARSISISRGNSGWDLRIFRFLSATVGWRAAGRMSELLDRLRSGP